MQIIFNFTVTAELIKLCSLVSLINVREEQGSLRKNI
jgi:hypothetical protein